MFQGGFNMDRIELTFEQAKRLVRRGYEWNSKTNARRNRMMAFRSRKAVRRLKKFVAADCMEETFKPNKSDVMSIITWFTRDEARDTLEKTIFNFVMLACKLHGGRAFGTNKDE